MVKKVNIDCHCQSLTFSIGLSSVHLLSIMLQVNNAGVNFNTGADNSVEFAEEVISTNYFGTKRMIKIFISMMRPSISGARILNVSSRLGRVNGRRNVRCRNFIDASPVLVGLSIIVVHICQHSFHDLKLAFQACSI